MEFLQTLTEYKDIALAIVSIIGGAGILGAIGYAINKRDNRLIKQGETSIIAILNKSSVDSFKMAKEIKEANDKLPIGDIDRLNAGLPIDRKDH